MDLPKSYKECYAKVGIDPNKIPDINAGITKENLTQCLRSKLWRLNNLYKIVNKQGELVQFRMNLAQHLVYAHYIKYDRIIILKSRQLGISTLFLIVFFDDIIFNNYFSTGLMAQDSTASENLLNRVKVLWDNFLLKDALNLKEDKNNRNNLKLSNGSVMYISTSFRSATLQRLHISEAGKIANESIKKMKEVKTGSFQTIHKGGKIIVESTAEGENMFKDDWYTAKANLAKEFLQPRDFIPVFLNWQFDTDFVSDIYEPETKEDTEYFADLAKEHNIIVSQQQKNAYLAKKREIGEYIKQEYPATDDEAFLYRQGGNFYAKLLTLHTQKNKRFKTGLYDPALPVQVAMDLGSGKDYNYLVFFQWYNHFRLIDEYFNCGEPIEHYSKYMKNWQQKNANIAHLILPHDAKVKEMTSGLTRHQAYINEGWRNIRVLAKTDLMNGIEQVRKEIINNMWFDTRCTKTLNSLYKYTKVWDDKKEAWRKGGLDNEHSHGADAVRYMVMGGIKGTETSMPEPTAGYGV